MTGRKPVHLLRFRDSAREMPPDYARVAAQLTTVELAAEIGAGRGEPGYQEALQAELAKRKRGAT